MKQNKLHYLLTILACLMMFSFSQEAVALELSQSKINEIENFVDQQMKKGLLPGLALVIVKEDQIIYSNGFGYADLKRRSPVTSDTLFEIGSTSKAFTAMAILQLREQGLLNLADTVSKYFPWFEVRYAGENIEITIEQLLNQTSGIPFESIDKIPATSSDDAFPMTVKTLVNTELRSRPGSRFEYATINYAVLGAIVEKVSGQRFEEYMQTHIFEPLGLRDTRMDSPQADLQRKATGYRYRFGKASVIKPPRYRGNLSAGYVVTNAQDFAQWIMVNLGTIPSFRASSELLRFTHKANKSVPKYFDGSYYGMGWFVYDESRRIAHGGNNPDYASYIVLSPAEKTGVGILTNLNTYFGDYIAEGVMSLVKDEEITFQFDAYNRSLDRFATKLFYCTLPFTVLFLLLNGIVIVTICVQKRRYKKLTAKRFIWTSVLALLLVGFVWIVYLFPKIFAGLSWPFILIWTPASLPAGIITIGITGVFVFTLLFLLTVFPKKDKEVTA